MEHLQVTETSWVLKLLVPQQKQLSRTGWDTQVKTTVTQTNTEADLIENERKTNYIVFIIIVRQQSCSLSDFSVKE